MRTSREQLAPALLGIQPRDERGLRIWTAVAMWLGGSCAVVAGTLLPGGDPQHVAELRGLVGFCIFTAGASFVVFQRVSTHALYRLTHLLGGLGAAAVWFAVLWSGGTRSGFFELYYFPVLYAAYFFRARQATVHVALASALAVSPVLYSSSIRGTQFPGHVAILIVGFWGMAMVIGHRKRHLLLAELDSRRQALSDPLTGLHNLRSLDERAQQQGLSEGCGVLLIDLDDFKSINTEYGHIGADELLREVGFGLLAVTDERDCVARIGGDEFAVLVAQRTRREIRALAEDCASAISQARLMAGLKGSELSGSVGHAVWPEDGQTLADLLAGADQRMYSAKASKRRGPDRVGGARVDRTETRACDSRTRSTVAGTPSELRRTSTGRAEDLLNGRASRITWRRERSSKSIAAGGAWFGASGATLIAVLIPHADRSHLMLVLTLVAVAAGGGAFTLICSPSIGDAAYLVSDVLAVPGIALAVYLTGGSSSPLLPLVFLAVAFAAYFSTPRGALGRLAAAILVCASPFLYSPDSARLGFVVRFVALATTALVLAGIILHNRRELAEADRDARELAAYDPLTGLPNRRAFRSRVNRTIERLRAAPGPLLAIAMIDADNFKQVNDQRGHATGDAVLRAISLALSETVRSGDCVARIGGDEFALAAFGLDDAASQELGARCIRAIEGAATDTGCADCAVSATVGYAIFPHDGTTLDELVEAADAALMLAKEQGKRRVRGMPRTVGSNTSETFIPSALAT